MAAVVPEPARLSATRSVPGVPWRAAAAIVATGTLGATLSLGALGTATAQTLAGRMGDKALVVLEGRTLVLAPGQSAGPLRALGWDGEALLVEHDGRRLSLRPNAAPVALGGAKAGAVAPTASREVVIPVAGGGHFIVDGAINGRSVRFMVDTGATSVALSRDEAARLGLDLSGARLLMSGTAAGVVPVQQITLARLRLGEVELSGVTAVVTPAPMPYVLLGNSALMRFQMRRENDVMRLELR